MRLHSSKSSCPYQSEILIYLAIPEYVSLCNSITEQKEFVENFSLLYQERLTSRPTTCVFSILSGEKIRIVHGGNNFGNLKSFSWIV